MAARQIRETGVSRSYAKELLRKDGSRVPVLAGATRLDEDGRTGVFYILDLTERRRVEEQAQAAQRLEAVGRLASIAVRRIEDGALSDTSLSEFAAELGVSDRHLRRAVVEHYGVSPIELLQTQRLLMAKRLLMDTNMPIGEVAMTSGFSSLRRFNATFKERFSLYSAGMRRARGKTPHESVVLEVGYRAP